VAIARAKHCEVIINERRGATFGKALGLKQATGKFVYFHEADVRFSTSMWLKEMVSPLILDQEAFGAECDWGIAKDFGSLNTYCALLQIADPLARMLSRQKPRRTYLRNGYLIKEFNPGDNPIMHCFLWRRSTIEIIPDWNDEFAEAKFFSAIIAEGRTEFIHINSTFANHYYVDTLGQFLRKRKKIARQFLIRNQNKPSWASRRSPLIFLLSVVYLGTFIGPLVEAIYGYAKTGRREWFWHPIVSFLTIAVYVFNFRKY
jgi:glycosyltransferase involved in cell wall biosynthesis